MLLTHPNPTNTLTNRATLILQISLTFVLQKLIHEKTNTRLFIYSLNKQSK